MWPHTPLALLAILSDAVLNNLITTVGAVVMTVVPTLTVIWQGRRTRQRITPLDEELKNVKRELRRINGDGGSSPPPAPDRGVNVDASRETPVKRRTP